MANYLIKADVDYVAPTGLNHIDGLLRGVFWSPAAGNATGLPVSLTYSFMGPQSYYLADYDKDGLTNFDIHEESDNVNFLPLTTTLKSVVREALSDISSFTKLTFTEVVDSSIINGDLRFGGTSLSKTLAWASFNAPVPFHQNNPRGCPPMKMN